MGWWWELTAASPRAGACRLRRFGRRGALALCRRTPTPRAGGAAGPQAVGAGLTHPSPTSGGLQCGLPVPLAPCSRTQAPRVGGLGASFRSEWGGGGSRRRQAREQWLAACGAAVGGHSVGYSEGFSGGYSGGFFRGFPRQASRRASLPVFPASPGGSPAAPLSSFLSPPPPPKNHRRRTAPARGPFAVCPHHRPVRNETQHPHPLLVGWGCVESEPKALAGGTAAPLLMGLGRVNTGPKALAGGTAAPPTATRLQWSCSPAACQWRSGGRRPCRC